MSGGVFFGAPRRAAHLIRREALEARLDDANMITTISAGAGFGKTALLSMWVTSRNAAGVWIDGSTAAGGRVAFWRTVFRMVAEAVADPRSAVLRGAALTVDGELHEGTVDAAVLRFARSLSFPVVFVIDDAHLLDLDAIGPDLVAVARYSTGSRVIVADRRRRFRPTRIASDVDETRITSDDLLLDAAEVAALVAVTPTRFRVEPDDVLRRTRGIAGLVRRLVAHGTDVSQHADDLLAPWALDAEECVVGSSRSASATAASIPPRDGAEPYLVATLRSATRDEAARLLGASPSEAAAVLDAAGDHGLGWWEGAAPTSVFRFAPVIADAAAVSVRSAGAPAQRRLAAGLAHVFAVRGDALTAFGLALDAGDFDLAVAIAKRSFLQMVRDDTPGLLRRLRRVPLARLRRHPLLVLFIAILHSQSSRGRAAAIVHFGLAEQLARATETTASPDDRAIMVGVRSATMRMQGKFDRAVPLARDFLDRFDRLTLEEQDRLSSLSRHLLWQVAHTLFFAGETEAAIGAAQRMLAVPVPDDVAEDRGIRPALAVVAAVQATAASMIDARATLEEAVSHARRDAPFYAVWERTAEALSAIESGEFARARDLLETLDHPMGAGEYWPADLAVRAIAEVGEGRTDAALRILETVLDADSPPRQAAAARDVVVVLRALLAVAVRPPGVAASVAKHISRGGPLVALTEAVIALRGGEPMSAVSRTGPALERSAGPRVRGSLLLVRAASCLALAQEEAAGRATSAAISELSAAGLATPWMLLTATERTVLLDLVGPVVATESVRTSVERMPIVFTGRSPVERLTGREREVLAELVAGSTIPQVAAASGVSTNTVKTQRARIYRKLGVDNRTDAARVAFENDLL
ncbi:helix-turn-helix transcriptional regulator [Labedella endophytica]|uniref:LuxR family transcriptional regulator n=1 Tax=Labedella endophytica TaxID=1523160 RepID=A0A3S0VGX2_9MICO|nr:LuxR family transcriptional regulator [Labedella endophytica]RUR01616.1 LuxR family transcriptional regulator [Labedella endophytica]